MKNSKETSLNPYVFILDEGVLVDEIDGQSPALTPMMVTTADTANSNFH
ncbi:hypothetical protein [Flavivirga rizhaonensis]|nr:hypothetical protein [Flavivirga rizhaonensis]